MNIRTIATNCLIRPFMVLVVVMTGILSLIGSGGDGGNFERVPDDYTLLPYYALRISGVDDPLDAFATGISLDLTLAGTPYRLRINPQALEGGFSCDVTTEVCVLADVDTATQVDVNDESTPPLFGDYRITILEPLLFQNADIPSDGTVDLTQDGGFGTISIEVATCSGSQAGVEITDNATLLGCYPWDQFAELIETSSVTEERVASMAYGILELLLGITDIAILNSFDMMDNDLETQGDITLMCDSYSSAGVSPPSGFIDQGTVIFQWLDDSADLEVGPGDSFQYNFNECWENDTTATADDMLDGFIDLIALTENVDATNTLIRIGYEDSTAGKTGGVFFEQFTWYETEPDVIPNNTIIASEVTINGGVTAVFSQP